MILIKTINLIKILILTFFIFSAISLIGVFGWSSIDFLDKEIWSYVYKIRTDFLTTFFKFITIFGNTLSLFVVTVMFMVILIFKKFYKVSLFFGSSVFIGALVINTVLKNLYKRPRPFNSIGVVNLIDASNYSYPSGHSMGAVIVYLLIFYLISVNFYILKSSKYFIFVIIFSILIAFSRVYLGVHYPSDILGGFSFGILWVMLNIIFYRTFFKRI